MAQTPMQRTWRERIQAAVETLVENLDGAVSYQDLADQAGFSPYHFHRTFRAMVGESPLELVRRLRLERSAHRLRATEQSITEIAFDAGFETLEAFSRTFRERFGASPSDYRRRPATAALGWLNTLHWTPDGSYMKLPNLEPYQGTPMELTIVNQLPFSRYAYMIHRGAYFEIGRTFGQLERWAKSHPVAAEPCWIASYLMDPATTPASDLVSRAGVSLDPGQSADGEDIQVAEAPAGPFARVRYVGPYSELGAAWNHAYAELIPARGLETRDAPCLEVYVNDCHDRPEELITDLYIPIQG